MPRRLSVTSPQNPRFRSALGLRESQERRRQGRIVIDGLREIGIALDAGVRPLEAYVDIDRAEGAGVATLADRALAAGGDVVEVTPRLLERLAYGDRDAGIVLIAETPRAQLRDLTLPAEPLLGVIEGVEKPGNLGAILRTADGAGLSALIVADPGTDLFNPNVIRASLGTIFTVPVAVASSGEVLAWLKEHGIAIVAARVDGAIDYTDAVMTGPLAIALGSEARGLSDAWAELATAAVRVPMLGAADSLNVAATAAILFYEAVRQRRIAFGRGIASGRG